MKWRLIGTCLLFMTAPPMFAAPVTWQVLPGTYFSDGAPVSGTMIVDPDLRKILSIDLYTGVGGAVPSTGEPSLLSQIGGVRYNTILEESWVNEPMYYLPSEVVLEGYGINSPTSRALIHTNFNYMPILLPDGSSTMSSAPVDLQFFDEILCADEETIYESFGCWLRIGESGEFSRGVYSSIVPTPNNGLPAGIYMQAVVPVPASLGLLASAFTLLGLFFRREATRT